MAKAARVDKRKVAQNLKVVDPQTWQEHAASPRLGVLKTYKLFIDGKFPRSESEQSYIVNSPDGTKLANICLGSRKDFRNAAVAARKASTSWSTRSAYNRGQILYRMAEMLEGRSAQFIDELESQGSTAREAKREVEQSIDRLVYYAGWSDKYTQIFSTVNPVSSSHFNFSLPEPTGVVALIAPQESSLLGLVSTLGPIIIGGNTMIGLCSYSKPLCAVSFAEVVNSSDVPAGVVNLLTGKRSELLSHIAKHMDINGLVYCGSDLDEIKQIQSDAVENLKRVVINETKDWESLSAQGPYQIMELQEIKTTWHPIGV
jgi:acyl-CoA reductase-like NAD-dependent aldehyde dehydrogenase